MTPGDGGPPRLTFSRPRSVALGGGHGLSAVLAALRQLETDITAVVTVADDGGSSGRLRADMPWLLPPGDLRMALCALAADDEAGRDWGALLQHRFAGGELKGHPVGNLLLAGLFEQLGDPVRALRRLARTVGSVGDVLPLSLQPLDIEADVAGPEGPRLIRGQVAVAVAPGRVEHVRLLPADPEPAPEALAALAAADLIVLGPGSLFTSQLPHLLVPGVAEALRRRGGCLALVLNLVAQPGEADGLDPAAHVEALVAHAGWFRPDVVLADSRALPPGSPELTRLQDLIRTWESALTLAPLAGGTAGVHDPMLLARALDGVLGQARRVNPATPGST